MTGDIGNILMKEAIQEIEADQEIGEEDTAPLAQAQGATVAQVMLHHVQAVLDN